MANPKSVDGVDISFAVEKSKLTPENRKKIQPSIDEIKKILEVESEPVFGRYTAFNAIEVS